MESEKYYERYEQRYRAAYDAGAERWGHAPDNAELMSALTTWVEQNRLKGRKIIEFACGEGAAGVILSKLGCIYHGVDLAPSALEKAQASLRSFPQARVSRLDMVVERLPDGYDAALDAMGLHMLVADGDRQAYLANAFAVLQPDAPMLFYKEMYDAEAYDGPVDSAAQWACITGMDYVSPRDTAAGDGKVEVRTPFLPARCRSESQYRDELTRAGFSVEDFHVNGASREILSSANIYVRRPRVRPKASSYPE